MVCYLFDVWSAMCLEVSLMCVLLGVLMCGLLCV